MVKVSVDWSGWFKGYVSDQNQADEIAWDLSECVGASFDGSTTDKDVLESVIDSFDGINSVVLGRKNDETALVMVGDMPCVVYVEYSLVKIQPIVSFTELAEYIMKNMPLGRGTWTRGRSCQITWLSAPNGYTTSTDTDRYTWSGRIRKSVLLAT